MSSVRLEAVARETVEIPLQPASFDIWDKKYRLVTRSDFDGLACAVLLNELGMIDEIKFVHPKDMQDGKVEISERDITTNLPYVPGVYLAFDHHVSETFRSPGERPNHIIYPDAPSAARVVYEHFGGKSRFAPSLTEMMLAVDNYDAQGKVWRVQESYPYVAWELPACVYQGYIVYDLNVGRYMADNMPQEGKVDWLAGKEGRIDMKRFNADELRRAGSR